MAVESVMAAEEAYRQIKTQTGNNFAVVKAQIHAGGRGKGKIAGSEQRGVAVGKAWKILAILQKYSRPYIGYHSNRCRRQKVNKILIAQDVYYPGP